MNIATYINNQSPGVRRLLSLIGLILIPVFIIWDIIYAGYNSAKTFTVTAYEIVRYDAPHAAKVLWKALVTGEKLQ